MAAAATPAKYALDTNLFIRGYRDVVGAAELKRFHTLFAPFEYLSAVVVQEFRAGLRMPRDVTRFEQTVVDAFRRRQRLVTPSFDAWQRSGAVLATLVAEDGLELARVPKRLVNDVLIALSCREAGVTLVTENRVDFERLQGIVHFEFVGPWPAPIAQ